MDEVQGALGFSHLPGKPALEVGVPLSFFELLELPEAGLVEPLGLGEEALVPEKGPVALGELFGEAQGSPANHIGRRDVFGEGEQGGVLQHPDAGGVLRIDLQDFHTPLSGQGVDLLQEGAVSEAVLPAAEGPA